MHRLAISAFLAVFLLPISAPAVDPGTLVSTDIACSDEDAALQVQREAKTDMVGASALLNQMAFAGRCFPVPQSVPFVAVEQLRDQVDVDGGRSQVWRLKILGAGDDGQDFFTWIFLEAGPVGLKV